jgi:hypothetical protein
MRDSLSDDGCATDRLSVGSIEFSLVGERFVEVVGNVVLSSAFSLCCVEGSADIRDGTFGWGEELFWDLQSACDGSTCALKPSLDDWFRSEIDFLDDDA